MTTSITFLSVNGSTWFADPVADGGGLINLIDGLSTATRDLSVDQRVGNDGAVPVNARRPPQVLTLDFQILGGPDTVLAKWGQLQAALLAGGSVSRTGSAGVRTLREVVFESSSHSVDFDYPNQHVFTVTLLALDPWWYGAAVAQSIAFGAPTPWDAPIAWDSAIPWNGGSGATITVTGDAPAFPLWTITGPMTELTVGDGRSSWTWTSLLTAGSYGTVDHRPGSRSPRLGSNLFGVAESGFGLWFLLSNASVLDWGLVPGANQLVVSAAGTTGASMLDLWYEPKWLTPG